MSVHTSHVARWTRYDTMVSLGTIFVMIGLPLPILHLRWLTFITPFGCALIAVGVLLERRQRRLLG